jgi:Tat protein secretion system quality control protein TatD with DNase activity
MRRPNTSLYFVDTFANLNRLETKLRGTKQTIHQLEWPRHSLNVIIDHINDPIYWGRPVKLQDVLTYRTIGIHPKYTCTDDATSTKLIQMMTELIQTTFFIGISTGLEQNGLKTFGLDHFDAIINLYVNNETKLPLFIHSRDADDQIIAKLNEHKSTFDNITIIWHNMNLGNMDRFQANREHFLQSNVHTATNCLFHPSSAIAHFRAENPDMNCILPESDSPHNNFRQNKIGYTYPIFSSRPFIENQLTNNTLGDINSTLQKAAETMYHHVFKLLNLNTTDHLSIYKYHTLYYKISQKYNINFRKQLQYEQFIKQSSLIPKLTEQQQTPHQQLENLLKESVRLQKQLKLKEPKDYAELTKDELISILTQKTKQEILNYNKQLANKENKQTKTPSISDDEPEPPSKRTKTKHVTFRTQPGDLHTIISTDEEA